MKSFTLNKSMREDVAKQLTTQAVKVQLIKIVAELEEINREFWQRHCDKVIAMGLPKSKWDSLIQQGMINSTSIAMPLIHNKNGGKFNPTLLNRSNSEYFNDRISAKQITGLDNFLAGSRYHGRHLMLKAPKAYPNFEDSSVIPTDSDLHNRIVNAVKNFHEAIDAANSFYAKTIRVLLSCRTSRQLENIFPEAAQLLPKRLKTIKNEVAPVELITSLKSMISNGIPPINPSEK
mgnify:CR=1 FL=1